jgi:hypothetical protein
MALVAHHFVITGTGHSARGAQATHSQGFYVIDPAECDASIAVCRFDTNERTKTFWLQQSAE